MRIRLSRLLVFSLAIPLGAACSKGDDARKKEGADPAGKTATDKDKAASAPQAPKNDLVEKVDRCWGMYEAWEKDGYRDCFAETGDFRWMDALPPAESKSRADAISYAGFFRNAFTDFKAERLVIAVNASKSVVVARLTGVHSSASMGIPPTGKPISVLYTQVAEHDASGRITAQRSYIEQLALLHQLGIVESATAASSEESWGPPVRQVAAGDDKERANVETAKRGLEAISKANVKEAVAMYADTATFRFAPDSKPHVGIKEIEALLSSYTPVDEMHIRDAWGAGDWVVVEITTKSKLADDIAPGTKGKAWELNSLELFRFAGGKVAQHWSFANGLKFAADVGLFDPAQLAPE